MQKIGKVGVAIIALLALFELFQFFYFLNSNDKIIANDIAEMRKLAQNNNLSKEIEELKKLVLASTNNSELTLKSMDIKDLKDLIKSMDIKDLSDLINKSLSTELEKPNKKHTRVPTCNNNGFWDIDRERCECDKNIIGDRCEIIINYRSTQDSEREHAFETIYQNNVWRNSESRSGDGSTVKWTVEIREFIKKIVKEFDIHSFLDAPCGDFNWMRLTEFPDDLEYVGLDIFKEEIVKHRVEFNLSSRYRFLHRDMVMHPPYKAFDLVFTRDALQHLSVKDVHDVIKNWEASGSKYVLTTFYTGSWGNEDTVNPGGMANFNLMYPPFNFVDPVRQSPDKNPNDNNNYGWIKNMGLWKLPIERRKEPKTNTRS